MPVLLVLCAAGAGGNTALSRKAGGSKGKRYGAGPATTDEALLSRLGEILGGNMKEDFMVVHLQEPCSFCRSHVHGNSLHKYVNPDRLSQCRGALATWSYFMQNPCASLGCLPTVYDKRCCRLAAAVAFGGLNLPVALRGRDLVKCSSSRSQSVPMACSAGTSATVLLLRLCCRGPRLSGALRASGWRARGLLHPQGPWRTCR